MTPSQFLELFISLTIQATVVIAATQGLCLIAQTAQTQSRLWNRCAIFLLALTAAAVVLPHLRSLHPWSAIPPGVAVQMAVFEETIGRVVFGIWLIGILGSSLTLFRDSMRTSRFLKTCSPAGQPGTPLGDLLVEMESASMTRWPPVRFLTNSHLVSPFCWQIHRPHIVLPEFLLDHSPTELRSVIRHELEHLRTGHPIQLFLQRIVGIAFWHHPLVRWSLQQAAVTREFTCDDAVAETPQQIAGYLRTLLAIAERGGLAEEGPGNVLAFERGKSVTARRARRLLEKAVHQTARPAAVPGALFVAALAAVAVAVSFVWVPVDVLASSRTSWSPWPKWSARALHTFDVAVRDFEPPEDRSRLFELQRAAAAHTPSPAPPTRAP
jgi:beta-lactamase regulating signal transducer with metallopeptidase domain